jgi:type I restriction enzyme S subunit
MSTKITPQLRFPEFTDEWQVRKLGDIAEFSKGSSISKNDIHEDGKIEAIRYGELYTTYSEVIDEVQSRTNLSPNGLKFSKANDVIVPASGETAIDIATASCVLRDNIALSGDLNIIRTQNNGVFMAYLLNNKKKNDIARLAQGVSVIHLYSSNLKDLVLNLPSKPEQEKIADFLTAVDERIAVGEKKLELLETYKRGVMQKIFSQQIRFKDENGSSYPDWEEKKLSDVLKERNTQTPISGEYPLMAFVAYKGVAPKGDRYNREFLVSDAKSKKYKQTQLGDFIYSSNNLETGSIGLNLYGSASISPVYSIFETRDGYSHQFLGAYLTRKKFIYQMVRYRQGVVYGQWRIHESEFLKIEEKFPCTGEQQKIAAFLTTLDDKITAEKSKLTAAMQFKKALLQRMFV